MQEVTIGDFIGVHQPGSILRQYEKETTENYLSFWAGIYGTVLSHVYYEKETRRKLFKTDMHLSHFSIIYHFFIACFALWNFYNQ